MIFFLRFLSGFSIKRDRGVLYDMYYYYLCLCAGWYYSTLMMSTSDE